MSVKRIWFENAPSGTIDNLQRAQLGVGYPLIAGMAATLTFAKQLMLDSLSERVMAFGYPTIPVWNTAGRPVSPKSGTIGFNSQTNAIEIYE